MLCQVVQLLYCILAFVSLSKRDLGHVYMEEVSSSSIVFHRCVYVSGRITLGVGSHMGSQYYLGRVALPGGLSFCLLNFGHVNAQGRVTLSGGLSQSTSIRS